jgi:hypothetical protein
MPEPRDDRDLELFLRQFEPRPPSPPARRRPSTRTWWALAAASLAASALWLASLERGRPAADAPKSGEPGQAAASLASRSSPTLAELSVVLRPAESARVAEELEGRVLPDPRRRGGALHDMASAGPEH